MFAVLVMCEQFKPCKFNYWNILTTSRNHVFITTQRMELTIKANWI